jgi:hypothetical protein
MDVVAASPEQRPSVDPDPQSDTGKDDLIMVEWAECRTTIGRMDVALEDLRKYGFTLVTGLLTASGLVGSATTSSTASQLVPAAGLVVMVLVLGLFALDIYYQVMLRGAVSRALELEPLTHPPLRLTGRIHAKAHRAGSLYAILFVYTAFLASAASMSWFIKGAHSSTIVVIAVAVFVVMIAYFCWGVFYAGKLHRSEESVLGS